ncbi:MAG: hypothetical protein IT307_17180 [Chloroflexi bacterium]|nr:hypothetical protein [Chloroflexota bacterium]
MARLLVRPAGQLKDVGPERAGLEASMDKLFASHLCTQAAGRAVQVHGGYGLVADNPIGRYFQEARVLQIGEGASELQHVLVAAYAPGVSLEPVRSGPAPDPGAPPSHSDRTARPLRRPLQAYRARTAPRGSVRPDRPARPSGGADGARASAARPDRTGCRRRRRDRAAARQVGPGGRTVRSSRPARGGGRSPRSFAGRPECSRRSRAPRGRSARSGPAAPRSPALRSGWRLGREPPRNDPAGRGLPGRPRDAPRRPVARRR